MAVTEHSRTQAERPASSSDSAPSIKDEEAQQQDAALTKTETEPVYPPTPKVVAILAGIYVVIFLTALDRLIIGVAIPSITNEFNSLGDVGWYGSSYLLTSSAFMLFMGKIYSFYDPKWVYLGCLFVFEVGSALCGAAPSSNSFIVGRAIAGLGSAGLMQGGIIIVVYIVPLHKRPVVMGFVGLVFGLASALGPLLGGAFTDGPGWRWCFYINLPCGGLVALVLLFTLKIPANMLQKQPTTWKEKVSRLDLLGLFFFLPAIICLLLALQWGGVTYNWSNARIIVLLIVAALCFIAFLIDQRWRGDKAMVPGRIYFQRSILVGSWYNFFNYSGMIVMFYYLPIWFQAIKGASAVHAGIMNLPMVLALAIASVVAGIGTKKLGYYTPWMLACSIISPIAAGMISTFTPTTGHSAWIGWQVMLGFGFGLGMQQASLAAQATLSRKDVSVGASIVQFSQTLAGAVFLSVGNNIFDSRLAAKLAAIPGIDIGSVVDTGATEIRHMVPASLLPQVLLAYNSALRTTFYLCVALTSVTIVGALLMPWKSIKQQKPATPTQGAGKEGEKQKQEV